jgi:ATP-dependent DNA helicase RecG
MKLEELKNLATKGESENLEFKKSTGQRTEAAKTVCALLNGLGGFIIFGVSDRGEVIGQQVTNKTLEDIAIELRRIEPPAFSEIKTIAVEDDRKAILVRVEGEYGTYTYDGRPYLRHGSTTQIMPRNEYERRLVERLHATQRWENQPVPEGITFQDLDEEEIHNTLKNAILKGRMDEPPHADTESILLGLKLIHKGKLLNAALALYGNSDKLYPLYPQFSIRLARFRGKNRLADFLDNRTYWGHAFSLLRRGESFLRDHVPIAGRVLPQKMIREDYPMYPSRALREAIANSICHRDYTSASGAVAIAMYDDHLEVVNPGSLHFGFTPDNLLRPHASKPWNPIIAEVLYRAGIIEHWGTGTLNILEWCKENQNPLPVWEEQPGAVMITFHPSTFFVEETKEIELANDVDQVTGHVSGQVTGHVSGQDKILQFCEQPKTAKEIMKLLGLKHRGYFYKNYLNPLLQQELLLMAIPSKPKSRNQQYFSNPKSKSIDSTANALDKIPG